MASKLLKIGNSLSRTLPKLKQLSGISAPLSHRLSSTDVLSQANTHTQLLKTDVSRLGNGFRIASESSGEPTCTVGLWINAGSRYETEQNNGVAHYLEHMIFKGTEKRSQRDLELEVENMGAHLNAYTSREQTVYYAKCFAKDIEKAVEILADITQNSLLGNDEIERERGVILREMQEVEMNQQEVVFDFLHASAFQGTPLGRTILGPSDNIMAMKREDLVGYIKKHYTGDRMVLAAAGGVEHSHLRDLAEKYFGKLQETSKEREPLYPTRYTGSSIEDREDDMPTAHVALAVEGAPWESPDNIALMVASTHLGSWDRTQGTSANVLNSFNAGVIEGQMCHSYMAFNTCYTDTGLWGIYFVADKLKVAEMSYFAQEAFQSLTGSITDFEIERAKRFLTTNLLLQLDGTTPVCEDIGRHMLCYGRRIPVLEMLHLISSLTGDQVREVCWKYFHDKCPVMASIGPTEQIPDYNLFRARMRQFRS